MSLLSLDISYYYPAAAAENIQVSPDEPETDMSPLRRPSEYERGETRAATSAKSRPSWSSQPNIIRYTAV